MSTCPLVLLALSGSLMALQTDLTRARNPKGGAVTVSAEDRSFIQYAARSGYHEVKMGRLGIKQSTNRDLRAYAQRIVDDHTLSNAEVEALARLKGIRLPDATKVDTPVVELSRLTGLEFDQEFVREAIANHLRDLAEFEKEDQSAGADPDIKGFADSMLPTLRAHLKQAKALNP